MKPSGNPHPSDAWFATTHWSIVLSARDPASPLSSEALDELCRAYWYPLYAYVRRRGHGPADAQDLTQEFFARLLEKNYLDSVAREKGRFRTFLIVALKRFLANEWDRARAQKRGSGTPLLSLDTELAERCYSVEPAADFPADRLYERRWALTLLEQTMARLREEFTSAGRAEEFERLKAFLTADGQELRFAEVARALGKSDGAVRVAAHRLRRRFREVFRELIAHTVSSPDEIDEEVRHLFAALSE